MVCPGGNATFSVKYFVFPLLQISHIAQIFVVCLPNARYNGALQDDSCCSLNFLISRTWYFPLLPCWYFPSSDIINMLYAYHGYKNHWVDRIVSIDLICHPWLFIYCCSSSHLIQEQMDESEFWKRKSMGVGYSVLEWWQEGR